MPNKFSIAMCTYNGARHLREQLNSFSTQNRLPDELVICDDGSTDDTSAIVAEFASSVSFPVRFNVNEINLRSTKNFERSIGFCTGDFIALSDHDDVWLPDKLQRLEEEFDHHPNVGLIFSDAEIVDEDTRPVGYNLWEKLGIGTAELRHLRGERAIDDLLQGATVTGATMAFRARFKPLVLPIPENLVIIHDAWIALLIGAVSEILAIPAPLVRYRQHSSQQVGPRERKTAEPGVKKALGRANSYAELIDIGEQFQQRLLEHRDVFKSERALSRLAARIEHLRLRANLPGQPLPRLTSVVSELFSGRYHTYSNGLASAAKDVLGKKV